MRWLSSVAPPPYLADTPSLPEHGQGLVRGTIKPDDASSTIKISVHSGTTAPAVFGCVARLDTGSPQTFIRHDVLEQILADGAAAVKCEQNSAPRSWGGFGKSASLRTSTSVRLSVQLVRADQPTSSLTVWAYAGPPSVMQHAVLLGIDSWMRFDTRFSHSFPLRSSDQRVFGELTLSHHVPTSASAFYPTSSPLAEGIPSVTMASRASLCQTSVSFSLSTWPSVTACQLLRATISSKCCPSRTLFLPKNILTLQGDKFPHQWRDRP